MVIQKLFIKTKLLNYARQDHDQWKEVWECLLLSIRDLEDRALVLYNREIRNLTQ